MILDGKAPTGKIQDSWDKYRFDLKLVNPANKRKYKILGVGTGLAGASAAATRGELVQVLSIRVDAVRPGEDAEVSEEVPDDEQDHQQARDRHHHLSSNRVREQSH